MVETIDELRAMLAEAQDNLGTERSARTTAEDEVSYLRREVERLEFAIDKLQDRLYESGQLR